MTDLRRVRWQRHGREDRAQKEPAAQIARQKVGVLALPAQPRSLRQWLFHHRRGVDKDLDLVPRLGRRFQQPAPQPLQPLLDQIVVIAPLRIDADGGAVALIQHRQRIALGGVQLGQHHHRPGLGPQRRRIAAPVHAFGHPAHLPVPPLGHEIRQPTGQPRHAVRAHDAHRGKSHRARLGLHPGLLLCPNTPGGIAVRRWGAGPPALSRSQARHNAERDGCPAPGQPGPTGTRGGT